MLRLRHAARIALLAGFAALSMTAPPALSQDEAAVEGAPASADEEALRTEMEAAYGQVAADFAALRGADPAARIANLEGALAPLLEGGTDAESIARAWTEGDLLGSIVAGRLAAAVLARLDGAAAETPLAQTLAASVDDVFPEPTVDQNWDAHFLDLDVVRRWRKLHGVAPKPDAPGDASPGEDPPDDADRTPDDPPPPPPVAAPDPADMVLVPRGELAIPEGRGRGWPDFEQKAESRTVKAFYIDRHEVSIAAYTGFLNGLRREKDRREHLPEGWSLAEDGTAVPPEGPADRPVTGVAYASAYAFADALDKRLPTEDEWERAARGDDYRLYPWGNEWEDGAAVAAAGGDGPRRRGSAERDVSPFGAVDMAGNVSEFCATLVDGKTVKRVPKDTDQVVRRGGNWEDSIEEAAADYRYAIGPAARSNKVGFRCAMDVRSFERKYGK